MVKQWWSMAIFYFHIPCMKQKAVTSLKINQYPPELPINKQKYDFLSTNNVNVTYVKKGTTIITIIKEEWLVPQIILIKEEGSLPQIIMNTQGRMISPTNDQGLYKGRMTKPKNNHKNWTKKKIYFTNNDKKIKTEWSVLFYSIAGWPKAQ